MFFFIYNFCSSLHSKELHLLFAVADCEFSPRQHPVLVKIRQLAATGDKKEGVQLAVFIVVGCLPPSLPPSPLPPSLSSTHPFVMFRFFLLFNRIAELVAGVYGQIGKLVLLHNYLVFYTIYMAT